VEVKRASTNRRFPLVAEKGNSRRMPPVKMTPAKLSTKILVGVRCREKKVLIRIQDFKGIDHQSVLMKDPLGISGASAREVRQETGAFSTTCQRYPEKILLNPYLHAFEKDQPEVCSRRLPILHIPWPPVKKA
jgi:hypothetical protein